MNALRQAAALAAIALVPATGAWALKTHRQPAAAASSPALTDWVIDPAAAAQLGAAALWLDARRPAEFAQGHIPGAQRLNEDEWDALLPEVLQAWTPERRVIVYCEGGECQASKQVAARLRDAGIEPVYVLRGGWPAWVRQGR